MQVSTHYVDPVRTVSGICVCTVQTHHVCQIDKCWAFFFCANLEKKKQLKKSKQNIKKHA